MPRLRLLCCSLATTEVGEYEAGIYDRHVCDRECRVVSRRTSATLLHCCASAQEEATNDRDLTARYRLANEIEALPLDGAAVVLSWLGVLIERLLREADRILRAQPGQRQT